MTTSIHPSTRVQVPIHDHNPIPETQTKPYDSHFILPTHQVKKARHLLYLDPRYHIIPYYSNIKLIRITQSPNNNKNGAVREKTKLIHFQPRSRKKRVFFFRELCSQGWNTNHGKPYGNLMEPGWDELEMAQVRPRLIPVAVSLL